MVLVVCSAYNLWDEKPKFIPSGYIEFFDSHIDSYGSSSLGLFDSIANKTLFFNDEFDNTQGVIDMNNFPQWYRLLPDALGGMTRQCLTDYMAKKYQIEYINKFPKFWTIRADGRVAMEEPMKISAFYGVSKIR